MRILFAAPITFDRLTFFISQYTISLAKAAQSLGFDVKVVQTTENMYNPYTIKFFQNDYNTLRKYFKKIIDFPHDFVLFHQLQTEIETFKPDLIFIYLIDTAYLQSWIKSINCKNIKIFSWKGVHPQIISKQVLGFLKSIDYVFIYDETYLSYYKNFGLKNVHVVPFGIDINFYDDVKLEHNETINTDISFIGILDEYREKFLIELNDFNLDIWSWKFNNYSILKNKYRGQSQGKHMVRQYKKSKIGLNIHRDFENLGGNYRLFEIPACQTLQLVDNKKGIGKYFEIDKEIVTFSTPEELKEKVTYLLNHPRECAAIATEGYNRVKKDHNIVDRFIDMLTIMDLL